MSKFPFFGTKTRVNNFDELNKKLKPYLPQNPVPTHVFNKARMDEFAKESTARREMLSREASRLAKQRDSLCRRLESLHSDMNQIRRNILRAFTKSTTVTAESAQRVEVVKERIHSAYCELEALKLANSLFLSRPFCPPLNPFDVVSWMEFLYIPEMSDVDRKRLQAAIRVIVPQDCWSSIPPPILPTQQVRSRWSVVSAKLTTAEKAFLAGVSGGGVGGTAANTTKNISPSSPSRPQMQPRPPLTDKAGKSARRSSNVSLTMKALNLLTSKLKRKSRKSSNFYHNLDRDVEIELIRWITAFRLEGPPRKKESQGNDPRIGQGYDEQGTLDGEGEEEEEEEAGPLDDFDDIGAPSVPSSENRVL